MQPQRGFGEGATLQELGLVFLEGTGSWGCGIVPPSSLKGSAPGSEGGLFAMLHHMRYNTFLG